MTNHYVQYHKASQDNPVPTGFTARTKKPGSVTEGDVVWLLVGVTGAGRKKYQFAYWFSVEGISNLTDGTTKLWGNRGRKLDPFWSISPDKDSWFKDFFGRVLGNGAFGFSALPLALVPRFEAEMGEGSTRRSEAMPENIAKPDSIDERQWQSILTRRGQQAFRISLIEAYGGRCAVSESRVEPLLEAAHINPHAEGGDYRVSNGILLRSDIHTLFDLHLLGIDESLRVHLKESIRSSEFARFHGKRIETLPASFLHHPSPAALQERFQRFLSAPNSCG